MIKRIRKVVWVFFIAVAMICTGFAYLNWRPVKIIAVHKEQHSYSFLVNHMPLSAKQKIRWWQNNKQMLSAKYSVPDESKDAFFNVYFWAFGEGYKELEKYDRLCFRDMPPPKNCIEKNRLMYITLTRDGEVSYWLNGTRYIEKADGRLVEVGFN